MHAMPKDVTKGYTQYLHIRYYWSAQWANIVLLAGVCRRRL